MNKKETIILSVIAVVTLILLVSGATYAFFTAGNSVEGTTSVTGSTTKIGSITVTNPTEAMTIKLTNADMDEASKGASYYATSTGANSVSSPEYNTVSRLVVENGEDDTLYRCSYTLEITKPSLIQYGDASIVFSLDGAVVEGVTSGVAFDLSLASKTYNVTFTQIGNTLNKDLIKASIKFNNSYNNQNHLIDKTLTTTITNSKITCKIAEQNTSNNNANLSETVMALADVSGSNVYNEGSVGYRYEGPIVDNYVSFNNETWRIISVEEGSTIGLESGKYYTKIIREYNGVYDKPLFSLNYDNQGNNNRSWSESDLYALLNSGDYYNRTGSFSNVGLTNESKELIVDANWYYSSIGSCNYYSSQVYEQERSDSTKVVKDAVGLMYPSDYAYAALQSKCKYIYLDVYNYKYGDMETIRCAPLDWLFIGEDQWAISIGNANFATYVSGTGFMSGYNTYSKYIVRPAVYLDSDIVITNNGDGSIGNKFEIGK